jgi:arylformamidase
MIQAPIFNDTDELLYQYSPSRWSKRNFKTSDDVVMDHVNTLQNGSKTILSEAMEQQNNETDGLVATLDVMHTTNKKNATKEASLDIFYPSLSSTSQKDQDYDKDSHTKRKYPVLIYIHGGYWQALDKRSSSWHLNTFRQNGVGLVALGYDLCPSVSFADLNEQVNNGIAKTVELFPGHPIYICGHSAGGHLAGMALCVDWKKKYNINDPFIHGFIVVSGCFDLRLLIKTKENDALKLNEEGAITYSPVLQTVSASGVIENVKGIIAFGENESDEFKRMSKNYFTYLKDNKYENIQIMELENEDHFTVIERLQESNYELSMEALKLIRNIKG